ncbi:MAG TPA: NUDIX domain-containing protein [Gammaproteobacteria bacterium]|jgi:ADP-ribose pyrophosphatase|nr:NUDIX domain-containing protein [Gammaproteobacteria bacterium]
MNKEFKILKREVLHKSRFCMVRYELQHRLFNGEMSEVFKREVVERSSATCVLPYDPIRDRVILIEQFRPGAIHDPVQPWLIEIPAGIIEENELPAEVAIREAEEEAHCTIEELYPICDYYASPGASNEYLYIFCGKINSDGVQGVHGLKHEHEDIRVINVTYAEAIDLLQGGKIKNGPGITALLWLQLHREKLQKIWC